MLEFAEGLGTGVLLTFGFVLYLGAKLQKDMPKAVDAVREYMSK